MKARKALLALAVSLAGCSFAAQAQTPQRTSDKQVKYLIERIERGADNFRNSLDDALDKSRLDDTRREDNINEFVKDFENVADRLKDRYSDRNTVTREVEELLKRAERINNFMGRHALTTRAQNDWLSLRSNLNELARAYTVTWAWPGAAARPFRTGEKEMEALLERIERKSDSFRGSLEDALKDSRLDGTRREDNINEFVKDFENVADRLKDRFDDDYSAVGAAGEVLRRAARIDNFMRRHRLTTRAQNEWASLRSDLDSLGQAYNLAMDWSKPSLVIQWQ